MKSASCTSCSTTLEFSDTVTDAVKIKHILKTVKELLCHGSFNIKIETDHKTNITKVYVEPNRTKH